jgi:probable rRNA maturation factor
VSIQIHWDTEPVFADRVRLAEAVREALEFGGRPGLEVNVVLVGDEELRRMHAEFLGDDEPTDVITFDLGDEGGRPEAELYVSAECARRTAEERGVDPERELALYLVHGTLHLCGYRDHENSDREAMRAAEKSVLDDLDYPSDDAPHDYLTASEGRRGDANTRPE